MNAQARIDWRTNTNQFARPLSTDATVFVVSLYDPAIAPLCHAPPNERDLADFRFRGASSRARFLERRSFMRSALALVFNRPTADSVVGYDEDGAPRLLSPNAAYHVSVAGRDDLAAIAVASRPVGVDLEPLDGSIEPIDAVLHASERAWLGRLPAAGRGHGFLRIWTMKEAYLKARRTGFRREPSSIEVRPSEISRARLTDEGLAVDSINEWRGEKIAGREVIAACVVLGDAFKL